MGLFNHLWIFSSYLDGAIDFRPFLCRRDIYLNVPLQSIGNVAYILTT